MKSVIRQYGFAIVEVLLIVVILSIVAFVAWRVIDATGTVEQVQTQAGSNSTPIQNDTVPAAKNASDLDTLEKQLDGAEIEDDTELKLEEQTTF
jgi:hypothetical protein